MNLQTIFTYVFFVIFISTEMWIKNKTLDFVPHLPSLTIYLGILISLAGFALRVYAVNYLGKNFTLAVQTTDSQQLVDHGPYAIVRNPAYTGSILSILGLSITSLNPLTIIISLILLVVGYSIRLRVEEKALGNHFGKNYEAYCQKVRYRVFPYIW